jgi:hypothetical protein
MSFLQIVPGVFPIGVVTGMWHAFSVPCRHGHQWFLYELNVRQYLCGSYVKSIGGMGGLGASACGVMSRCGLHARSTAGRWMMWGGRPAGRIRKRLEAASSVSGDGRLVLPLAGSCYAAGCKPAARSEDGRLLGLVIYRRRRSRGLGVWRGVCRRGRHRHGLRGR